MDKKRSSDMSKDKRGNLLAILSVLCMIGAIMTAEKSTPIYSMPFMVAGVVAFVALLIDEIEGKD